MNFKKMITLIEMLALTGVMSVGFSTWVIVETSFNEIDIKVDTENVFDTNHFLTISNITFSDYSDKGFYPEFIYTDSPVYIGYLEFDLIVDLSQCYVSSNDSLMFYIDIDTDTKSEFDIVKSVGDNVYRGVSYYNIGTLESNNINETNKKLIVSSYDRSDDPLFKDMYYFFSDSIEISENNRSDYMTLHLKYGFDFINLNNFTSKFMEAGAESLDGSTDLRLGIPFHIVCSLGGKSNV